MHKTPDNPIKAVQPGLARELADPSIAAEAAARMVMHYRLRMDSLRGDLEDVEQRERVSSGD